MKNKDTVKNQLFDVERLIKKIVNLPEKEKDMTVLAVNCFMDGIATRITDDQTGSRTA